MRKSILIIACATILALDFCLIKSGEMLNSAISSDEQEFVEWEVYALCLPHEEISGPTFLLINFAYIAYKDRALVPAATMNASGPGGLSVEQQIEYNWDYPSRGILSVIFAGPPVTGKLFCQPAGVLNSLHISYYPQSDIKLAASTVESFTRKEMDSIGGPVENKIPVSPQGKYQNEYSAGRGTQNPYWLQVSIPIHSGVKTTGTTAKYNFLQ